MIMKRSHSTHWCNGDVGKARLYLRTEGLKRKKEKEKKEKERKKKKEKDKDKE